MHVKPKTEKVSEGEFPGRDMGTITKITNQEGYLFRGRIRYHQVYKISPNVHQHMNCLGGYKYVTISSFWTSEDYCLL